MPESDSPNSSPSIGRRWLIWLNTFVTIGAFLALMLMINYLAAGHFARFEMDRNSSFKLSPQTVGILDSLTNDVNITIFFQPNGENEEIYGLTTGLLTEYQKANPRHVHVKTLDYTRDIAAARELLTKYRLTGLKEKDFVMVESGGQEKVVYAKELADYDFSDLMSGRSKYVRRNAFRGEMFFTGDIYAVINPRPLKAYFLYGHGENNPDEVKDDQNGYSKFAGILKNELNCDWQTLSLEGTNAIPSDCQLLIVAASARAGKISTDELSKIAAYLKQGGRMFALLTVYTGLESVLTSWGVGVGNRRVVDLDKKYDLGDYNFYTATLVSHPIMNLLASDQIPIRMVFPRPVGALGNQAKIPGAPEVTVLALTSPSAMDQARHVQVFPLIVAVEQGVIQGVNSPRGGGTRMVVVGDSDFLDDTVIDSVDGNHYFAGLALSWLLEQPQIRLSGLGPRPIKEYKLLLSHSQMQTVQFLFLAVMPGAVLLLGGLVWLRRRS